MEMELADELATLIPMVPFKVKTWFTHQENDSRDYVFIHVPDDMEAAHYAIRGLEGRTLRNFRGGT